MRHYFLKQFLAILLPVTALFLVIAGYNHFRETGKQRDILYTNEKTTLSLGASMITKDLRAVVADLMIISQHAEFKIMHDRLGFDATGHIGQDFSLLIKNMQIYDQVRYIDETGMEIIRANFNDGRPSIVPKWDLQNKSQRYYFRDAIKLNRGEIYFSPMDLNVEHGKIEQPFKPMIRLGTPVFDGEGHKRGIVILNYLGNVMIRSFETHIADIAKQAMILNSEGYWLHAFRPELEWGFMLGHDETFQKHYPAAWERIVRTDRGQFEEEDGLFTFDTVYPLLLGGESSAGETIRGKSYFWKVVSHVPAGTLAATSSMELRKTSLTFGPIYLLLAAGVLWLASTRTRRFKAEKALLKHTKNIERLEKIAVAANEAETIEGAVQTCLDEACALAGWPVGHCYILAEDGTGELMPSDIWHLEDPKRFASFREITQKTRFPPGFGLPGRVLSSGQPEWISNVSKDPNFPRATLAVDMGVKAGFGFPVMVGRETMGVLEFFSDESVEPDHELLEMMIHIGTQLGQVIERQWAEKKLRAAEERTRLILESAGEGVYGLDTMGRTTFVNRAASRMVGWEPEELLGKSQHDILHHTKPDGSYYPREECPIYNAFKDGKVHHVTDELFWRKDGSSFQVEYTSTPIHMGTEITGAVVLFRDVTERRQTEESLRKLSYAVEQSPTSVVITDTDGNIEYVNPKFCESTGYSAEEAIGKNPRILKSGHMPPEKYEELWKIISSGGEWRGEMLNKRKDGSLFWEATSISAIKAQDGRISNFIAVKEDITERKKSEEELILSKEAADKANQAKSDFLSSMSHELRTPLNAILGFGQMLEFHPEEPLTESQKSCVDHITKGGQHLLELINDVLDLAKIEAGKIELSIENVSTKTVVDDCLPLIQTMANERGIQIVVGEGFQSSAQIRADYTRFKQSLLNLMSNAVKYNREKGKITIDCHATLGGMLHISVADTGEGIPDDMLEGLFEPFNRLKAENTEIEGTGIGLTITKQLIERMDGHIGVYTEVGKGSTFWIELPQVVRKFVDEAADVRQARDDGSPLLSRITGTVLYVEDNPANLQLMELIIERIEGLSMISAHNAELGIELAKDKNPDIIILDINLPGMNGFEALMKLQGLDKIKDIPVIAVSAAAMPKDIEKGIEAGFKRYLTKPIKVEEVVDAIKDYIER